MSKTFRVSKNRSSSSTLISLHFNKADEEQLEISYSERSRNASGNSETDQNAPESTKNRTECSDNEDKSSTTGADSDKNFISKSSQSSKESTPSRDSVMKEYWSKISKRGSSVDSDLGVTDKPQDEGWMFFKDIKGKLAKTMEERKSVSKGLSKDDRDKSKDFSNRLLINEIESDSTPTDYSDERLSIKLSPAVEASEMEEDTDLFADYINDELAKTKCEIFSSDSPIKTASSTNTEFYLNQPIKKTDSGMSRTTLLDDSRSSLKTNTEKFETESAVSDNYFRPHSSKPKTNISKMNQAIYFVRSYWNTVIFRIMIAFFALLFVPIPSWISGFVCGAFLSGYAVYCLVKPGKPKEPFVVPDFSQMPSLNIPVSEVEDDHIIYKGWVNELPFDMSYNPDAYHVNCTHSLYIRLDGSYLRCSYPQNNIPKRAMFNERRHDMQFIHQHHYDITGCSVELLPVGLARKRLWSKKYPICLKIPNPKQSMLSNAGKDIKDQNLAAKPSSRKESPSRRKFVPRINENNEVVLYLFSRTDREKDLWYNRFKKASRNKLLKSHSPSSSPNIAAIDAGSTETSSFESKRAKSIDLSSIELTDINELDSFTDLSMTRQQKYELYMAQLLAPESHFSAGTRDKKGEGKKKSSTTTGSLSWLNVLIGRVFFDFLTEDVWGLLVAEKIKKKLSKIKLPVFLSELIVKDINLGTSLPKLHRASEPTIDQKGMWIDFDVSYNGSFHMTLETTLNLLKKKSTSDELSLSDIIRESDVVDQVLRSPVYNSEEEDSAESSTDEEISLPEITATTSASDDSNAQQAAGSSAGKRILRLVDRLAQSSYFQHAAKNKYIQKTMQNISKTPLVLTVEVQWLTGTVALNVPPMPTDRLWYGFRTNPNLSIVARPKLGQHVVTLTHVTDWIEKKLVSEFQKILVMPNMDDLMIPIMQSDAELPKFKDWQKLKLLIGL